MLSYQSCKLRLQVPSHLVQPQHQCSAVMCCAVHSRRLFCWNCKLLVQSCTPITESLHLSQLSVCLPACLSVCLSVSVSFIQVLLQVRCQGQEDQEQACAEPQQDGCSAAGGGNAAQAEPGVPGRVKLVCTFATSDHCNLPWTFGHGCKQCAQHTVRHHAMMGVISFWFRM